MSKKSKSNKETLQNLPSFETTEDEIRTGNNLDREAVPEVEKEETEETFTEEDFIAPETQPTTEPTMEEEFHESIKPKDIMRKRINFWCFIILALVGGFFGLQEFYRGNVGLGILAVLFCWTCIPAIVAAIEALVWLFRGPEVFDMVYNKGIAE